MTPKKRFLLGGGGALMPVLVSFLAIDIGAALSNEANLTTANIVGIAIRYIILFMVGGIVAYLHEEEHKPFKLFELGIAAPALITSLITAQSVASTPTNTTDGQTSSISISLISSAHAANTDSNKQVLVASSFLNDLFDGLNGNVYRDMQQQVQRPAQTTTVTPEKQKKIKSVTPKQKPSSKPVANLTSLKSNMSLNNEQSLRVTIARARSKAATESKKAKLLKLKTDAAKAKVKALETRYQASLAMIKTAKDKARKAELKLKQLKRQSP